MSTVDLTEEQLENVRREMMKSCAKSLEIAADALMTVAEVAPWPESGLTSEAIRAVRIARLDLESLDALGWPENDRGD